MGISTWYNKPKSVYTTITGSVLPLRRALTSPTSRLSCSLYHFPLCIASTCFCTGNWERLTLFPWALSCLFNLVMTLNKTLICLATFNRYLRGPNHVQHLLWQAVRPHERGLRGSGVLSRWQILGRSSQENSLGNVTFHAKQWMYVPSMCATFGKILMYVWIIRRAHVTRFIIEYCTVIALCVMSYRETPPQNFT